MSNKSKQWIYHKEEKPMVIEASEFEKYKTGGWSDTPATFIKLADFGVDPNDNQQVQALGEAISGVNESINGALNIDLMTKDEVFDYALTHFKVEISKRNTLEVMRDKAKSLVG